jgi:hypothetical protein
MTKTDDLPSLVAPVRYCVSCDKPKDLANPDSFVYTPPKQTLKPGEVKCWTCARAALPGLTRCATCRGRWRDKNVRKHQKKQEILNASRVGQKQCAGCPRFLPLISPERCPKCQDRAEQRVLNQKAKAAARKKEQEAKGVAPLAPGLKKCRACGVGIAEDGPTRCRPCADKQNAKRKGAKSE